MLSQLSYFPTEVRFYGALRSMTLLVRSRVVKGNLRRTLLREYGGEAAASGKEGGTLAKLPRGAMKAGP